MQEAIHNGFHTEDLLPLPQGEISLRMLDLFSGLGGASEAMLQAGWDVLRIDNNELLNQVPNTIMADICYDSQLDDYPSSYFDLIWSSPPCLDFSRGFNAPAPTALREGRDFQPDMEPLRASIRIIKEWKPRYWVIENVSGASKIFSKELGVNSPRQIIGPYFLWGNFPYLPELELRNEKGKTQYWNIGDPLRANKRALIPFELSEALRLAIEEQRQLTEWI